MNRLLVASVNRFGPLDASARGGLAALSQTSVHVAEHQPIVKLGDHSNLKLLVSGVATRQVCLPSGQRQILGIAAPGDLLDLSGLFTGVDHEVWALSSCEVRITNRRELSRLVGRHPSLVAAFMRAVLTEASAQRKWLVNVGARSAVSRAAHLFCEVYTRMDAVAQAAEGCCAFPAMQADIAEALGLSGVHTHRVLKSLAQSGLATLRQGTLTIGDWGGLAELAGFDGRYLQPQHDPLAAAVGKYVHLHAGQIAAPSQQALLSEHGIASRGAEIMGPTSALDSVGGLNLFEPSSTIEGPADQ